MFHQLVFYWDKLINRYVENIADSNQIIPSICIGNEILNVTGIAFSAFLADCGIEATLA